MTSRQDCAISAVEEEEERKHKPELQSSNRLSGRSQIDNVKCSSLISIATVERDGEVPQQVLEGRTNGLGGLRAQVVWQLQTCSMTPQFMTRTD